MGVIVPIVLFVSLVTLVLAAPRLGPLRAPRLTRAIARTLTSRHGVRMRSEFTVSRIPLPGPPFHYGAAQRLADQVIGTHDGWTDLGGVQLP